MSVAGIDELLAQRWAHRETRELVLLDNRDSFVYNLAHRLAEVGRAPVVVRSDRVSAEEVASWRPRGIVISPGPGHPRDAGCSIDVVRLLGASTPILGVCLGHQAIAEAFGGRVGASGAPMHGRASWCEHDGRGLFSGLDSPMQVARYHSLVVREPLPRELIVTSRVDGFVMGLRHETAPIFGVQFHPESVLTEVGWTMLRNFVQYVSD